MNNELTAPELLKQVSKTYRATEWYQDSGYLLTSYTNASGQNRTDRIDFATHFRRPNLFRFEWHPYMQTTSEDFSAVWSDGTMVYEQRLGNRILRVEDSPVSDHALDNLALAIAGATGVSGGTAHDISSLLISEIVGRKILDIDEPRLGINATKKGKVCCLVQGLSHDNRDTTLWISATRNILLKVRQHYEVDPVHVQAMQNNLVWIFKNSQSTEKFLVTKTTIYQSVKLNLEFPLNVFCKTNLDSD